MLQGGASGQFASVPLNLLGSGDAAADYITTGQWSEKAVKECKKSRRAAGGPSGAACAKKVGGAGMLVISFETGPFL